MNMKIAFIVCGFPTLWETFILNQITGLIDMGYDVEIFAEYKPRDKKIHPDVEKYNLMNKVNYFDIPKNKIKRVFKAIYLFIRNFNKNPVKMLNSINLFRYGRSALSLKLLYLQIPFLNKKFDVIHCHFGFNGSVGVLLKKIGVSNKVITTFHGFDLSSFIKDNGEDGYKDLFINGDLFLPISDYWRQTLIRMNCDDSKIIVHRVGIDLNKFNFFERKYQHGDVIKLLTIGRLVEKKGHEYVLKALKKVVNKRNNILYTIAGSGPLRTKLESLVDDLDLMEYVKFVGNVTQDQAVELYHQSHFFILPSVIADNGDQEGIPVVLMEAQASGLPVISTYHSGIPEGVANGQSGFLVPERDVDALTSKIEYLIEHPDLWPILGKAGRGFIEEKFNINKLNKRLIEIFQL